MSWVLKQALPVNLFEAYAISGTDLYVGNDDFAIRHWNMQSRDVVNILRGHKGKITDMVFSAEWKALFSTSIDGRLLIWVNGKLIGQFLNKQRKTDPFGSPLYSLCFYPRRDQLFVGAFGQILIFNIKWDFIQKSHERHDIKNLFPTQRMSLHTDVIHKMITAGDKLITASLDRTIGLTRIDSLSVNKTIQLTHKQAITSITYDYIGETLLVGSIDGKIYKMTRDGLIIQYDTISTESAVMSIAIENKVGLTWVTLANRQLKLLDYHNLSFDLTEYFDTLRVSPILGIDHYNYFGVYYDRRNKAMYAFANDHYVFDFRYEESAPRISFMVNAPMHAVGLYMYEPSESIDKADIISALSGEDQLRSGIFIIGGNKELQIMSQENRFQFSQIATAPSVAQITAVTESQIFIAYADDAGNVYAVNPASMQIARSSSTVRAPVSSIHLTDKFVVVTTIAGSWHLLTLSQFPEPLEEITTRELAHNGSINDSAYNHHKGSLLTAGSDGLLKVWVVGDSKQRLVNGKPKSVFLTDSTAITESNIVDMRRYGEILNVCWAIQADRWITAHGDSQVRIWNTDLLNCQMIYTIPCGGCHITTLAIDDPDFILAGLDDKTIRCFSIHNAELIQTFVGHTDTISSISTSPDIDYYVSSSWDSSIKVWSKVHPPERSRTPSSKSPRRPVSSDTSSIRVEKKPRPQTALPARNNLPSIQPISIYEKRRQEIERKRRREKAEYDAKMRTPFAREIRQLTKLMAEIM